MKATHTGQRAPGWVEQPAAPPRDGQRMPITPAARAAFAASGSAPPTGPRDGRVIRRADALKHLRATRAVADRVTDGASSDDRASGAPGHAHALGTRALGAAPATDQGTAWRSLSASAEVLMHGGVSTRRLAHLVSACVREVAALIAGPVDTTVCRAEDMVSAGRGVRLRGADQLVAAQIERALDQGTHVSVEHAAKAEPGNGAPLPLLIIDGSESGLEGLSATGQGIAVVVGAPRKKVVPVDVGGGDLGVGVRMASCVVVTVGPSVPSTALRALIDSVSAVLVE